MSSLRFIEKDCIEEVLGMSEGHVLDFTTREFGRFLKDSAGVDIFSGKYELHGNSKANRLRAFIELEDDLLVGRVLSEMLEYRQHKAPELDTTTESRLDTTRRAVSRLLGSQIEEADAGTDFLQHDFGPLSLAKIPSIGPLSVTLEARFDEAIRCLRAGAPLAVIFHCGGILEGLLLGVADTQPKLFNQSARSPKDKDGDVKPFRDWTLAQLIDVSCELGYLRQDVKQFSHALRDFRNYIHPYQQLAAGFQPDKHTAEICLQVLRAAVASLSRKSSQCAKER